MSRTLIKPQNLPETLVWYYIIGTYVIYFLGAQYLLTPLLATFLTLYLVRNLWQQTHNTTSEDRIFISPSAWIWIIAILTIELALIVGHFDFNLGISQIVKSSVNNWYRRWALFALFPLIGHLKIRPQLIYRAVCILCLQSLIIILIGTLAGIAHIPNLNYVSPLSVFGGGSTYYHAQLFHGVYNNRLILFSPYQTYLGLAGNIYFCFALQEKKGKWRFIGLATSTIMIFGSASRAALVCLPFVLVSVWFLTKIIHPWIQFLMGGVCFFTGIFFPTLLNLREFLKEKLDSYREDAAGSSKLRSIIYRMTIDRWRNEALIWGHGRIEESGPAIISNIPVGTHQTWLGILYAYGLVGCVAFGVAFLWSLIDLIIKAQNSELAKVGLSVILILLVASFTGTIEYYGYLFWPGLVILGTAFKEKAISHQERFQLI